MKYLITTLSLATCLLLAGCGKNANEKKADIKASLSVGDKVLVENPEEIYLSLNNDSLVVHHNIKDGTCDTIFNTGKNPANRRLGVFTSKDKILMMVQMESDSILSASYDIATQERSYTSSGALGILPYQGCDSIKFVVVHNTGDAIYTASYNLGLDCKASPLLTIDGEVYNMAAQRAKAKKSSDDAFIKSLFGIYDNDGHMYWWQCHNCGATAKSSGKPPYRGCPNRGDAFGGHDWYRGNRVN